MQAYSDPARENNPYALPNAEIFFVDDGELLDDDGEPLDGGYYWQACFPGCIPDGEPIGPFATEAEALADLQDAGD
jgi:hypothetical protein